MIKDSKILIIDDESVNGVVAKAVLGDCGYKNVVCSINPMEAVKLFAETAFDLVILDLMMPGMDGYQVMAEFSRVKPGHNVPILIVTALSDTGTEAKIFAAGATDYLSKPYEAAVFTARVGSLLKTSTPRDRFKRFSENNRGKMNVLVQQIHDLCHDYMKLHNVESETSE